MGEMDVIFDISNKDDFKKVTEDILSCLLDTGDLLETSKIFRENDFNAAKEAVKNILNQTYCDTEEINKKLSEKGYNKELIDIFCCNVQERKSSLLVLLLLQHNSSFGESVVSFDWLVKLVYGTSELKTLKYPLLQLAMTTINNKQEHINKTYDISRDMLIKLIDVLENIV